MILRKAHPYPQGDKRTPEFNRIFLNYIKDKPFYIIDRRTGKPVPKFNRKNLVGDSLSGLYYVGDLMGGNFIFDANARVIIRYEMIRNGHIIHKDAQYWIETAIDNFESGVWVLREWYHNGLTYSDVVKNLNTVQDFNPFSELNESEEWFESEEDYTKYFVVGQKFRFNSRSGDAGTFYGQIVKVNRDYVWITPPSLAKMSRGTRFSKERILGLLVNGDWTPVKTPIKESTELRKVIEPGMSIYCHTDVREYKAGKWYTIYDVDYNAGINGEDLIKISNPEDEYATEANWTIQKDENDLNYENWFTFGDTEFDTNKAFDSLYESEEGNDLVFSIEEFTRIYGKSMLKESTTIPLRINDIVTVNGFFQGKNFNNKVGTIRYFKGGGEIVGIEFEGWSLGHNGRNFLRSGPFWEFFMDKRSQDAHGYTITPIEIDELSDINDLFNQLDL